MITKQIIGRELYVWFTGNGKTELLYKRWLDKGYGMVMGNPSFTAKDTEELKALLTK